MALIKILIRQTDLSHLTASCHKNTHSQQNNQKNSGNHHHHGHLCPPLSGGFNLKVSKIALRPMIDNYLRNAAMQILYVQLTFPLFFYCYSTRHGSASSRTNCEFLLLLLTLFLGRCVGTKRTDQSCQQIIFLPLSDYFPSCFGVISDGGGHSHCLSGFGSREREIEHKRTW